MWKQRAMGESQEQNKWLLSGVADNTEAGHSQLHSLT